MIRQIKLCNQKVSYTLKTSRRSKLMRLAIYHDGSFVVTKPWGLSENMVEKFIRQKSAWVLAKLEHFKKFAGIIFKDDRREYLKYKDEALDFVKERLNHFNNIYHADFDRISIRNQKTRWGSCSKNGNLNFNYKILLSPQPIADYIIVHELCHLLEFNHSRRFWNLVAKAVPNYLEIRKELKNKGLGTSLIDLTV